MEEWLELSRIPSPLLPYPSGNAECLLDTLDWVGTKLLEGRCSVGTGSANRSNLLPARRSVRFGEASARASLRKLGRALNES